MPNFHNFKAKYRHVCFGSRVASIAVYFQAAQSIMQGYKPCGYRLWGTETPELSLVDIPEVDGNARGRLLRLAETPEVCESRNWEI